MEFQVPTRRSLQPPSLTNSNWMGESTPWFTSTNLKEAPTPWIYQHQLEGGSNSMNLPTSTGRRLQPSFPWPILPPCTDQWINTISIYLCHMLPQLQFTLLLYFFAAAHPGRTLTNYQSKSLKFEILTLNAEGWSMRSQVWGLKSEGRIPRAEVCGSKSEIRIDHCRWSIPQVLSFSSWNKILTSVFSIDQLDLQQNFIPL